MINKIIKKLKELADLVDKLLDRGQYQPSDQERKSIYDTI